MGDTVDKSIEQIEELLKLLYEPPSTLDMLTREDIKTRYRLTGLRGPAIPAIEQARRIIRATGDYDNMGLFELHIGLVYLQFEQYKTAAHQFTEARRFWSFVDRTAASCLARFGQACSLYHTNDGENAMIACGRGLRCLDRFERHGVAQNQVAFAVKLREYLTEQQNLLRDNLRTADEEAPRAPELELDTVPAPIISDRASAVPGHSKQEARLIWYKITRILSENGSEIEDSAFTLVNMSNDWNGTTNPVGFRVVCQSSGTMLLLKPVGWNPAGERIVLGYTIYTGDFVRNPGFTWLTSDEEKALTEIFRREMQAEISGYWFPITSIKPD